MSDNATFSLIEELLPRLRELGVARIGVFGSAARNELRAASDIDILVEFSNPSAPTYFDVLFLLEDAFGRKIDLAMPETLHPMIRAKVFSGVRHVA